MTLSNKIKPNKPLAITLGLSLIMTALAYSQPSFVTVSGVVEKVSGVYANELKIQVGQEIRYTIYMDPTRKGELRKIEDGLTKSTTQDKDNSSLFGTSYTRFDSLVSPPIYSGNIDSLSEAVFHGRYTKASLGGASGVAHSSDLTFEYGKYGRVIHSMNFNIELQRVMGDVPAPNMAIAIKESLSGDLDGALEAKGSVIQVEGGKVGILQPRILIGHNVKRGGNSIFCGVAPNYSAGEGHSYTLDGRRVVSDVMINKASDSAPWK